MVPVKDKQKSATTAAEELKRESIKIKEDVINLSAVTFHICVQSMLL